MSSFLASLRPTGWAYILVDAGLLNLTSYVCFLNFTSREYTRSKSVLDRLLESITYILELRYTGVWIKLLDFVDMIKPESD